MFFFFSTETGYFTVTAMKNNFEISLSRGKKEKGNHMKTPSTELVAHTVIRGTLHALPDGITAPDLLIKL